MLAGVFWLLQVLSGRGTGIPTFGQESTSRAYRQPVSY